MKIEREQNSSPAEKSYFPLYIAGKNPDNTGEATAPKELQNKIHQTDLPEIINAAREDERQRIGHELHDSINSLLVIAKLYLRFWVADSEKEKLAREQVAHVIHTVIENIRYVSSESPFAASEAGNLVELIADVIKRINGINLLRIRFSHAHSKAITNLEPDLKMVIYRIVQEQLNNTIKYSKAGNVTVRLSCLAGGIRLAIRDDGVGFDPSKTEGGIGLLSIRKRVKSQDGKMQLKSLPGKGCKMTITFPI